MVWVEVTVLMAVLAVLAYWRYTPNPPAGMADRQKRGAYLRRKKIALDVVTVLEFLGVTTIIHFFRAASKYLSSRNPVTVPDYLSVTYTTFEGVKVVVFEPKSQQEQRDVPGLVFCHGGAFCLGHLAEFLHIICHIAEELGVVVVFVDYRLAPEHPFPAGLNDCVTATKYFIRNARRYNVDPSRIGIYGSCSGGNFAAVVALKLAQEKHHPGLKLQLLVYPVTQFLLLTESVYKNGPREEGPAWLLTHYMSNYLYGNKSVVDLFLKNPYLSKLEGTHYLNFLDPSLMDPTRPPLSPGRRVKREDVAAGDDMLMKVLNPHVSPLLAEEEDVKGLPPAFIIACEFDSLRDHGIFYAKRLERAGVKVKMIHYKDGYHGQLNYFEESEAAMLMMEDVLTYLKENL